MPRHVGNNTEINHTALSYVEVMTTVHIIYTRTPLFGTHQRYVKNSDRMENSENPDLTAHSITGSVNFALFQQVYLSDFYGCYGMIL